MSDCSQVPSSSSNLKSLHSKGEEIIYNVHKYFCEEQIRHDFLLPLNKAVANTAKASNVSERTVERICSKRGESSSESREFSSLPPRKCLATVTNIDGFDKSAVRRTVLSSYNWNELPT